MAYIMINVDTFENTTSEEKVLINVNAHKIKCIRKVTCENHDGYATVVVSYKMDHKDSPAFYTQTAKDLDLSFTKRFQMIIDSRDICQKADEQFEAA